LFPVVQVGKFVPPQALLALLDDPPGRIAMAAAAKNHRYYPAKLRNSNRQRVASNRQQIPLALLVQTAMKPPRTAQFLVADNPALGEPFAVLFQHLQTQTVPRAITQLAGHARLATPLAGLEFRFPLSVPP